MRKFLILLIVVAFAVIVGGVVLATVFSRDAEGKIDTTRWIAIFGVVLGAGSLLVNTAFNVTKTWHDITEKDAEKKNKGEKIIAKAQAYWDNGIPDYSIELYNDGMVPVNIRNVYLKVRKDGEIREEDLGIIGPRNRVFRAMIMPKEYKIFHADYHSDDRTCAHVLVEMKGENFWVEVHSFVGEVARVLGSDILLAIKQAEPAPSPPPIEVPEGF